MLIAILLTCFLLVLVRLVLLGNVAPSEFDHVELEEPTVVEPIPMPDTEPIKSDESRQLSETQYDEIIDYLTQAKARVSEMEFPEHLSKHKLYDTSAKQALMDLASYLYRHKVPVPLFENRVGAVFEKPPKICLFIASTRRKNAPFSYLVQTVSALLNRMNYLKYKDEIYIHVFNVDSEPRKHTEADIVKHFVPVTDLNMPLEYPAGFEREVHLHENLDHAEMIRTFDQIGCEVPILVEDDALATTDWVESVLLAIQQLHTKQVDEWFMVRLYAARTEYPRLSTRGITDYDPLFSSVSLLLNKKFMLRFAEELVKNVEKVIQANDISLISPKDIVASELGPKLKLKTWAFEPVIFQHTGVYSAVANRSLDVKSANNWIMFSKYYDADGIPVEFNADLWASKDSIIST